MPDDEPDHKPDHEPLTTRFSGEVPQDYRFERVGDNGMPETVPMSKLFGRHDALILHAQAAY